MANVNHNTLSDPYLHEPKGASTAASGDVYVADGAGSGAWTQAHTYVNGYIAFDSTTPAYSHSVTTSFTVINPTFILSTSLGWTGLSSPNARLRYDGAANITAAVQLCMSFQNNSGTNKDLEVIFRKNGGVLNGAHAIDTAINAQWKTLVISDYGSFSTNDYLEVFVKGSASFTLNVASANLTVLGVPV
jgi:hypothetical protein